MIESFVQDLRYAARQLGHHRLTSLVIIATLAIGIGANTAVFTVFQRTVASTLPVRDPDRLVHVAEQRESNVNYNHSYPWFRIVREEVAEFSGVVAHSSLSAALTVGDGVERTDGAAVSANFFRTMGVRMARGRDIAADDESPGGAPVVVVSDALWRRLGARDDLVGTTIRLNDRAFEVVGVAEPAFHGLAVGLRHDFWIGIGGIGAIIERRTAQMISPRASWLDVFARLRDGATLVQAQASLARLDPAQVEAGVRAPTSSSLALDGSQGLTFAVRNVDQPLRLLMGVAALLLLLASATVANLLLARADSRRRELAVRLALGARRGRLVQQLLTESVLLGVLGGAAGLLIAQWGVGLLVSYAPPGGSPLAVSAAPDATILAFTAVIAVGTALLFGIAPARRASDPTVVPDLKGAATGRRERLFGLRGALVVTQVAVSLVLVAGATLFLRTVANLQRVDVGVDARNVLLASIDVSQRGYDAGATADFWQRLLAQTGATPGVVSATAARVIAPSPAGSRWEGVRIEGYTPPEGQETEFDANNVAPGYFETLGIGLISGRVLDERDIAGTPLVTVVNDALVQAYFAGRNPIGQHLYVGEPPNETPIEIVGVVRSGKYRSLREDGRRTIYLPLFQHPVPASLSVAVRTQGDPAAFTPTLRDIVRAIDPVLPVANIRTLEAHIAGAMSQERMIATLSTLFGLIGLGLAALGLFGLIAHSVAQRTREIGLRVALGARPGAVVALMVARGAVLVGAGVAVGLAATAAVSGSAASLLFGVGPGDPVSMAGAVAVLCAAGLAAAWVPARRAARVDPMVALRID